MKNFHSFFAPELKLRRVVFLFFPLLSVFYWFGAERGMICTPFFSCGTAGFASGVINLLMLPGNALFVFLTVPVCKLAGGGRDSSFLIGFLGTQLLVGWLFAVLIREAETVCRRLDPKAVGGWFRALRRK